MFEQNVDYESFHAKSSQTTTQPSHISMKVGELVDSIENNILGKLQCSLSCSFCGAGVQKS
jgi:hypothetical protein